MTKPNNNSPFLVIQKQESHATEKKMGLKRTLSGKIQ